MKTTALRVNVTFTAFCFTAAGGKGMTHNIVVQMEEGLNINLAETERRDRRI